MPKVRAATYAGVCFGVKRAIEMLDEAVRIGSSEDRPVFMLGPLIHNPRFIEQCRSRGIIVTDLDGIVERAVVIIRSHGITRAEEERLAHFTDLRIVDTTCPFVRKIHRLVAERSQQGDAIVVLGDSAHAEVQGFLSRIDGPYFVQPPDLSDEALAALDHFLSAHRRLFAVAQTTSQPHYFSALVERMRASCLRMDCRFEFHNTVCDATFQRQNAARELARAVEAMVVIGGKNSSNTAKLYDIVARENPRSYWVESPEELTTEQRATLGAVATIGLTAGASTPDDQIAELTAYLEAL